MSAVGIVAIVLLALAVAVVLGAEWPRIGRTLGAESRASRSRQRRKQKLTVVRGEAEPDDADDFARSVERDLANLPVIEKRDR